MTGSVPPQETEQDRAIAQISDMLRLPVHEVGEVYKREFFRLAEQARIPNFLAVLAMRNTRSILLSADRRSMR